MIITKMSLPRRTFLRGIGATRGAAAAGRDGAGADGAGADGRHAVPRGSAFVYVPNGMHPAGVPAEDGRQRSSSCRRILKPLAPFRDQLIVVSGLANAAGRCARREQRPALARQRLLADRRARRSGPRAPTSRPARRSTRSPRSELGKDTPLPSLELALEPNFIVGNCDGGYSCAYINTHLVADADDAAADGDEPARRLRAAVRRRRRRPAPASRSCATDRSILDSVTEDMARLQRSLGPRDRRTVDEYLDAVRDVEQRHPADRAARGRARPKRRRRPARRSRTRSRSTRS